MISKNKKYSPSFRHDLSKSFESFSTVKIQVRKFAGSLLYGKISNGHHLSMHSQRTDTEGVRHMDVQQTGCLLDRTKASGVSGERCWLWRAAGWLFHESPAATGVLGSHRFTFCLQPPLPSLFPHWANSHAPFFPPVPLWLQGWSEAVNHLSSRSVAGCHLLWPGPQGDPAHREPGITWGGGRRSRGRGRVCNTQSLAFTGKALRKRTNVCEATQ